MNGVGRERQCMKKRKGTVSAPHTIHAETKLREKMEVVVPVRNVTVCFKDMPMDILSSDRSKNGMEEKKWRNRRTKESNIMKKHSAHILQWPR